MKKLKFSHFKTLYLSSIFSYDFRQVYKNCLLDLLSVAKTRPSTPHSEEKTCFMPCVEWILPWQAFSSPSPLDLMMQITHRSHGASPLRKCSLYYCSKMERNIPFPSLGTKWQWKCRLLHQPGCRGARRCRSRRGCQGRILPRDGKSERILASFLPPPLKPHQTNSPPFCSVSQPLKEGHSIS